MGLREILASEGLMKTAAEDFELTSVPKSHLNDAVHHLAEGTRLLRNGKYIGKAVEGGYAFRDGGDYVYVKLDYFTQQQTTIRLSKKSLEAILSV